MLEEGCAKPCCSSQKACCRCSSWTRLFDQQILSEFFCFFCSNRPSGATAGFQNPQCTRWTNTMHHHISVAAVYCLRLAEGQLGQGLQLGKANPFSRNGCRPYCQVALGQQHLMSSHPYSTSYLCSREQQRYGVLLHGSPPGVIAQECSDIMLSFHF